MLSKCGFLCAVISLALTTGSARALALRGGTVELGNQDVPKPFGDCPTSIVGEESPPQKFFDGASLAFYPLTDAEKTLFLRLTIGPHLYKVKLDGTYLKFDKCDHEGMKCSIQQEEGIKTSDFIQPQVWNYVSASVNQGQVSIKVASRDIMKPYSVEQKDLQSALWSVASTDVIDSLEAPRGLYWTQFDCNSDSADDPLLQPRTGLRMDLDYMDDTENQTSSTSSEEKAGIPMASSADFEFEAEDENGIEDYGGLIVGLVVGAIVLVTLSVVLYQVYKRRKSASVSIRESGQATQKN